MADTNQQTPETGVVIHQPASQAIIDKAKADSHAWLNPETWRTMQIVAQTFVQSGAMPKEMNTAPKLMVVLQAGKEAGLQPLEAVNSFYFVNGKIALYGDMAIAQVLRAGHKVEWGKCDATEANVKITRGDNGASNEAKFTMAMATARGLTKNAVYQKYPENMLRFKAFHACAKFIVSDALHGVPVKEIVEAEVEEIKTVEVKAANVAAPVVSKPVESLEDAINKEPEKKVEEMPKKEVKKPAAKPAAKTEAKPAPAAEAKIESPAAKKMREAKEAAQKKAKEDNKFWPEDVLLYLKFIDGIADADLPEDIILLKKDAIAGEWKGYDYYPSLRDQIAMIPADFK